MNPEQQARVGGVVGGTAFRDAATDRSVDGVDATDRHGPPARCCRRRPRRSTSACVAAGRTGHPGRSSAPRPRRRPPDARAGAAGRMSRRRGRAPRGRCATPCCPARRGRHRGRQRRPRHPPNGRAGAGLPRPVARKHEPRHDPGAEAADVREDGDAAARGVGTEPADAAEDCSAAQSPMATRAGTW